MDISQHVTRNSLTREQQSIYDSLTQNNGTVYGRTAIETVFHAAGFLRDGALFGRDQLSEILGKISQTEMPDFGDLRIWYSANNQIVQVGICVGDTTYFCRQRDRLSLEESETIRLAACAERCVDYSLSGLLAHKASINASLF